MNRFLQAALVVATLVAPCARALAEEPVVDVEKAATVKAAYLLNFIRYSQWPDDAFEAADSPIVVTEVGNCPESVLISAVVRRAQPVAGHTIELQHAPYGDDDVNRQEFWRTLEQSHLVFVCSLGEEPLPLLLERLSGRAALTVGDIPGFVEQGGMIGFVLEQDRILFEANPKAIQKSRVTVSAKVLKLAKIPDATAEGASPP